MLQKRLRKSYEMDTTVDKTLLRPPLPRKKRKKYTTETSPKKSKTLGRFPTYWLKHGSKMNQWYMSRRKRATLHGTNNANKIDPDDLGKHKQIHSAIDWESQRKLRMKRISLALPTFPNPSAAKPQIGELWLWIRALVADHGVRKAERFSQAMCDRWGKRNRQCRTRDACQVEQIPKLRQDRTTSLMPSLIFGIWLGRHLEHVILCPHTVLFQPLLLNRNPYMGLT